MKTMMLADFLALAKSLPKNVALWALLFRPLELALLVQLGGDYG